MNDGDIEDRVRTHEWPEISADLRQRVLSITVAPTESLTWSDRVWFSRGWRLAAVAAVVLVVVLDQAAGESSARVTASPRAMAEAKAVEELAVEAGLPTETAARLAQRSLLDASRPSPATTPDAGLFQILDLDTTGGM